METRVVVVGAGFSGLSAALLLTREGCDVRVLEARDRVGGRVWSTRHPSYQYTDLGAAYVGSHQKRILSLAKQFNVETYKVDHAETKSVFCMRGSRRAFDDDLPFYNPLEILDVNNLFRTLDAMAQSIPLQQPWGAPKAQEWDQMTYNEFLQKTCWADMGRRMGTFSCQILECAEPHQVSLLSILLAIAGGNGVASTFGMGEGAQESKFVDGAMTLCEKMAGALKREVEFSSAVTCIDQTGEKIKVTCLNGKAYDADYVICGVPVALVNRISFNPPLPAAHLQLIQRMPMGSVIKGMLFYGKAYWREKGLSGEIISDSAPAIITGDDTKPDGSCPCLMNLICAQRAVELCSLSVEERGRPLAAHAAEGLGCPELNKPLKYVEKNWCEDEWAGGCYCSYLPPGVLTQLAPLVKKSWHKVYFAASDMSNVWGGYMEGGILEGERAARQILHSLGKLDEGEVWKAPYETGPYIPGGYVKYLPSVPVFMIGSAAVVAASTAAALYYLYRR